MGRYVVGIDNGSQSTKVSVFDERGRVMCSASRPLRTYFTPRPEVAEHPDDDIWDSIAEASRAAMAAFDGDPGEIAGVGLCTIRYCRALLRADGTLAAPVMSWMDQRVSRPYVAEVPDVAWITTSSGYATARMTGQFRDTVANYQGMWPLSTDRWSWLDDDDEGFVACNMPRDALFELVMPGDVLGRVSRAASAETGLPEGLPVFATANDKAVEALGCGLSDPGDLLVSLGTYIASMTLGEQNRQGGSFWSNFASIPHRYLYESGGIRRGMWTVSWWRDLLGAEAAEPAAAAGLSPEAWLDQQAAATVPPGSDGLMVVLDWLATPGIPFRKGSMLGFDGRHGRLHVHRAILEGIALTIGRCATEMGQELGRDFNRLVVSGGGSASRLFLQIFADVLGLPAERTRVHNAVGLGAAICATVGLGWYPSFEEAMVAMVSKELEVPPEPANHDLYRRIQPIYDSIPACTDPVFERSHPLFVGGPETREP
jgi:sugar (pentulose or hexulose) kinase